VTRTSIHEYVAAQRLRYLQASRRVKRRMLDEVVTVTGYHRKAALRRLHHPPRTTPRAARIGRPRVYGPAVTAAAQGLWEASGEIGAVRRQPCVPELLDRRRAVDALRLTPETAAALRRVSAAMLKRLLAPIRATRPPRGVGVTRAGTGLKPQIPIRTLAEWDEARPGVLEGDLVAPCGPTPLRFYLCTLCAVDIVTGWAELEAVWGKDQERGSGAIHRARQRLPMPCSAGIAIRVPSSSTRPSGATASARASPLLAAAPTARTIAPTSSRRTAPSGAAGSAMIGSPPSLPMRPSMPSIACCAGT
jgi:hypothetical protein